MYAIRSYYAVVSNTVQATDQPVGKYYITVTDNNGLGCSVTDSIVITVPNPLVISNIVKGATNCNDSVGIATATVIGGVEPYAYQWYQTSSGLSANIAYADSSTRITSYNVCYTKLLRATAVAGNITVTPNSTCGSGTSSSLAVTIDEIPSAAGFV